ncbi:MAG TPA: DUF3800 domain-containing protein [Rhizomicrobium sp.]|nr:DUF3800 domain-containing protein [Rhizomicrobium sp.]
MTSDAFEPEYHYVAYIDEAGDPGLDRVKPLDNPGSAEWLIVSAVVIPVSAERSTDAWIKTVLRRVGSTNKTDVHFRKLSIRNKVVAASALLPLPIRCFVVCSNKKNMRGYINPRPVFAHRKLTVDWFYAWMTRVILERVTHFVRVKSLADYHEVKKVKLVYSQRGGLSVHEMGEYYDWIQSQSQSDSLFLPWGDLQWDTLSQHLLRVRPHQRVPGLQMADIVASSFFQACDKRDIPRCDNLCAKILEPRMGRFPDVGGRFSGYGVKLLPNFKAAKLDKDQQHIFTSYGYPYQLWQDKLHWDITPPYRKNVVAGPSDPEVF